MVLSSNENDTSNGEDMYSGQLLHDIEEISRSLYLDKAPSKALLLPPEHQPSYSGDELHKDKKSSIWKWRPLKALTHIRDHQFTCCFFLHVHTAEGLPSNFNDLILCVNWKRKNEVLRTRPVRVFQGVAEFEETLMHQCTVYGNRHGHQRSVKYDPKLFLLNASVIGAPALDIGKHWVDLARLLPLTLEELEEEKRTSGKWTTSFKLKGKAKGAVLNVSFGFSIFGNNPFDSSRLVKVSDTESSRHTKVDHFADHGGTNNNSTLYRRGSVRRTSTGVYRHSASHSLDMKFLDDVFTDRKPELAQSITLLCQKLDEEKISNRKEFKSFLENPEPPGSNSAPSTRFTYEDTGNDLDNTDFVVIDRGIESSVDDEMKVCDSYPGSDSSVIETIDVADIFKEDLSDIDENINFSSNAEILGNDGCERTKNSTNNENDEYGGKLNAEDPSTVLDNLLASKLAELNFLPNESRSIEPENDLEAKPSYSSGKMLRSLSLDDVMDSVANEFLDMLGTGQIPGDVSSESESESPRERLLRESEMECLGFSDSILGLDAVAGEMEANGITLTGNARVACADDFDLSFVIQEAEKEQNRVTQSLRSRRNTKVIENLETESLMQRWGLNERAFQNSPHTNSGGFGSPVYPPPEEPYALPPIGEGLGSVIVTKGGGYIRSMNSSLFKSAKNGAKLILQVSKPLVLPAVMGSNVMEILQCWASEGAHKMSIQLNELMPLEDITAKTMQQVMDEASAEVIDRSKDHSFSMRRNHEEESRFTDSYENLSLSSLSDETSSDHVSLEDLVPLAVAKIEALSIEGLRIQSGLSDEEAPSSIRPELPRNWTSLGENIKLTGISSSFGVTDLQLLDVKRDDYIDEVIKLSLSLDQWVEFDRVRIGHKSETDECMKILAAYGAKLSDMENAELSTNEGRVKLSGNVCGLLGDNFTLAFRLQLRDPFRDYEMVGASMLALAQVERVCIPQQPERYRVKSLETHSNNTKEDDLNEEEKDESINEQVVPQFKISEVHVAGITFEPNDNLPLSTRRQLQSGSRWLLSNGMARIGKKRFSSSNAIIKSSSQILRKRSGNILWSLSSQVQYSTDKWKELAAFSIRVRNPDIIFSNEPL